MKKKKIIEVEKEIEKVEDEEIEVPLKKIDPIMQEFGNGEINLLRDKINEIITCLSF